MTTVQIFTQLRERVAATDRSLLYLARKSGVPYHRLYRFHVEQASLPMEDAEKLHIYLTGKTFIVPSDDL